MHEHQKVHAIFPTTMPQATLTREPDASPEEAPEAVQDASAVEVVAGDDAVSNQAQDDNSEEVQVPTSTKRQDDDAMADAGENKARVAIRALKAVQESLANIIQLLEEDGGAALPGAASALATIAASRPLVRDDASAQAGRVIEGVFNGQHMVGSDGKIYSVPPNYASKSKLVEGDLLKLTITNTGSFIYKQIGPIDRKRVVGTLGYDQTTAEHFVTADDRRWSVLKASVTFFKGEHGDEAVVLVPLDAPSRWGAVENIIRKNPAE